MCVKYVPSFVNLCDSGAHYYNHAKCELLSQSCLFLGGFIAIVVNVGSAGSYFKLQICRLVGYYTWDLTQE